MFALNPNILTDKPIRSISINAKCYEMATSAVELQNPFPADCEFTVKLVNFSEEEQEAGAHTRQHLSSTFPVFGSQHMP